jgi:hypothetical protein
LAPGIVPQLATIAVEEHRGARFSVIRQPAFERVVIGIARAREREPGLAHAIGELLATRRWPQHRFVHVVEHERQLETVAAPQRAGGPAE